MPRLPRILQDEYPYHVATRTAGKIFVFKDWTYKIIIGILVEAGRKYGVKIHHFKMMHTHYHMIVTTPLANLSKFQWYINHTIARMINRRMDRKGHLWGQRYSASIVQKEDHLGKCIKYIYMNGVRVGICNRASEDKQFSTFDFYARGKKVAFSVEEDCVYLLMGNNDLERQRYFLATVDEPMNDEEIKAIRNGLRKLFYGSADFVERMRKEYFGEKGN